MRWASLLAALWLAGCAVVDFGRPGAASGEGGGYAAAFPFYAEYCALSQIKKKPGFGAEVRGDIGGHAVLYLNGACRGAEADRQVLRLCDGSAAGEEDGVGISMTEHLRNAKWIAVPGRAFFFDGGLRPDETLTRARYLAVRAEARRLGLYDGVAFHPGFSAAGQPGMSPDDRPYEALFATDYAVGLGRGRYCARVPVTRARLAAMLVFLNAENAPYRSGREEFRWDIFRDNCIHLIHNTLAAAEVWDAWPTKRPLLVSLFDFPVPKNDFVNLARRVNDLDLLDPAAVFRDGAARRSVLRFGQLPVRPGALALSWPAWRPNEVYETELKLVFYDEPHVGPYRGWLNTILADSRRSDLGHNLLYFQALYRQLQAARQPLDAWLARAEVRQVSANAATATAFHAQFHDALDREVEAISLHLERLRRDRPLSEGCGGACGGVAQ